MKGTYFGFNKRISKFQDGVIMDYYLFMVDENKYYVLCSNDSKLIKEIFNEQYKGSSNYWMKVQ